MSDMCYCDWCGGIKNPKAEYGPFKPRQLCDCGNPPYDNVYRVTKEE